MTTRSRGWWVDESLPDLSDVLPASLEQRAFAEWLGPALGRYRNAVNERALVSAASLKAELDDVRRVRQLLLDVPKALRDLPTYAASLLSAANLRHWERIGGESWHDIAKRIARDSTVIAVLLAGVEKSLFRAKAKLGRPTAAPRDQLLDAIVRKLRKTPMGAVEAREMASHILKLCKIDVPNGERAVRRAAGRGQKGGA